MTRVLHIIKHNSRGGAARALIAAGMYSSSKFGNYEYFLRSLRPDQDEPEGKGIAVTEGITIVNDADIVQINGVTESSCTTVGSFY